MGNYLICQLVHGGAVVIKGSVGLSCYTCGRPVWVAPTGQERLADTTLDLRVMCTACFSQTKPQAAEIEPIQQDQLDEVRAEWERRGGKEV